MGERTGPTGIEQPPRLHPAWVAAGAGLLWGAFAYSVLWEGTPFAVDQPFVESVRGMLVLLPARITLWGVHAAEVLAGRTFELSRSTWILAVATAAAGVATVVLAVVVVRGVVRLARR